MTTGRQFCDELLEIVGPVEAARISTVLSRWAGRVVHIPARSTVDQRTRLAKELLAKQVAPQQVAMELREQFGITLRTAQRDIASLRKRHR